MSILDGQAPQVITPGDLIRRSMVGLYDHLNIELQVIYDCVDTHTPSVVCDELGQTDWDDMVSRYDALRALADVTVAALPTT